MDIKQNKNALQYNSYFLGEESLLIQCAEVWLRANHLIKGIVTSNPVLKEWARQYGIVHLSISELLDLEEEIDFIFSIVNPYYLPSKFLAKARVAAINFHDSLLPYYAGTHATSWAIYNGEARHGVSWHKMTERLDAGDIVKQASFTLAQNETTLSLNIRCYELALSLYEELIVELQSGELTCLSQEQAKRHFYEKFKKPCNYAIIDWYQDTAESIHRLVRGSYFGQYPNRLASAKIYLNNQYYILNCCEISNEKSTLAAGTIVAITTDSIVIATATHNIICQEFQSLEGEILSITALCAQQQLVCGDVLPVIPVCKLETLTANHQHEAFWHEQLLATAVSHFFPHTESFTHKNSIVEKVASYHFANKISDDDNILFSLLLTYIYRILKQEKISISYHSARLSRQYHQSYGLINSTIPFSFTFNENASPLETISEMSKKLAELVKRNSYLTDIFSRYPDLRKHYQKPRILISTDETYNKACFDCDMDIAFVICRQQKKICIFLNQGLLATACRQFCETIPEHLAELTKTFSTKTMAPIKQLPLLPENVVTTLTQKWCGYVTDYPKALAVHTLFENISAQFPNKIAVSHHNLKISYRELNRRANQLARFLRKEGIMPGSFIAVLMDRSIELLVAILAICKIKSVYVPIAKSYPTQRIKYILEDCQADCILTNTTLNNDIHKQINVYNLINLASRFALEENTNLELPSSGADLLYTIYTSGSTGKPKGVLTTHKAVMRLVKNTQYIKFMATDKIANLANVAFDAVTFEIWGALLNTCELVIIDEDEVFGSQSIDELFREKGIDIAWITTAMFHQIVNSNHYDFHTLRCLLVGGEKLSKNVARKFLENKAIAPTFFLNTYGPTENTTFTTAHYISEKDLQHHAIPLGKPIANTQVYVLDDNLQLVPPGAVGELYIAGDGLAECYVNAPELNQQRFLNNPFTSEQSVLYRSGDLVRWLFNGCLEIIGRQDEQLKLRGFRICLTEIETQLQSYPGVSQCAVVMSETACQSKQLWAFYSLVDATKVVTSETFNRYLEQFLPEFMLPHHYQQLTALPLTSSGKIDKKNLMQRMLVDVNQPSIKTETAEDNLTFFEKTLLAIWRKLLRSQKITIHDNFFHLGGDSILAMQVVNHAAKQGIKLKASDLFQNTTIAKLTNFCEFSAQQTLTESKYQRFDKVTLLPIQAWFFQQKLANRHQYIQYVCLDCSSFDTDRLIQALAITFNHYPILQSVFNEENGQWYQYFNEQYQETALPITKVDILDIKNIKKVISQQIEQMSATLNISKGELFKANLLNCINSERRLLILVAHHLVIDGVSWRIFVNDLNEVYQQLSGLPNVIPATHHNMFAKWSQQLHHYHQKLSDTDLAYWHDLPQDLAQLPKDYATEDNLEAHASDIEYTIALDNISRVLSQANVQNVLTIQDVLLTALVITLEQWIKSSTLCLNIEGHGREALFDDIDLSQTLGWFTSLFPVAFSLPNKAVNDETKYCLKTLRHVRKVMNSLPHKGLLFGVAKYLANLNLTELQPEISFNYLGHLSSHSDDELSFYNDGVVFYSHPENKRAHTLDVTCFIQDDELKISWRYSRSQFNKQTIQEKIKQYGAKITQLIDLLKDQMSLCYVTSDFPEVNIDAVQLNKIQKQYPSFKSLWPLSDLQAGVLFESLRRPNSSIYINQIVWHHHDLLDVTKMYSIWQEILHENENLGVSFLWQQSQRPIQVVHSTVCLPFIFHDWSDLNESQANNDLVTLLDQDRERGFDLARPPLMRLIIIKLKQDHYVFLWSHHHILLDGWSIMLFLEQVYRRYHSKQSDYAVSTSSYYQHLQWSKKQQNLKCSELFWRHYLADSTATKIPFITQHDQEDMATSSYSVTLTSWQEKRLKQFAMQHDLTLNTIFQFAWSFLISRYTNSLDVVIGMTIANRHGELTGIDKMMGLLINTLPFRLRISPDQSVLIHLLEVQTKITEIQQYGYQSLDKLAYEKNKALFDTLFVFENYPSLPNSVQDLTIHEQSHYPLSLIVYPHDALKLSFYYQQAAIAPQQVVTLANYYRALLYNIIDYAEQTITELSLYDNTMRERLLRQWVAEQSQATIPTLLESFDNAVKQYADKIALISNEDQLTYAMLNHQVSQLAHDLQQMGIVPGKRVGVYLGQGKASVIALLCVLKLKAVYVPIDPSNPDTRTAFIIEDAELDCIITHTVYTDSLEPITDSLSINHINKKQLTETLFLYHWQTASQLQQPDNILYILYTSGSTGKPKGAMITQQGASNVIAQVLDTIGASAKDILLAIASPAFDLFVFEILGSLTRGMQLIVDDSVLLKDTSRLNWYLNTYQPTIMQGTPSHWELLLHHCEYHFNGMHILSAGEALSVKLAKKLRARGAQVWNLYGATEAAIHSTLVSVTQDCNKMPLGLPLTNTALYCLDSFGQPTPEGGIGELYVGGVGLAHDYLKRPVLSQQRFIYKKMLGQENMRMYRTGDLAFNDEQMLIYAGRTDDQIKVNGLRFELGEIQHVLSTHPLIEQSVVLWLEMENQQKSLVAFYTSQQGELSVKELKTFLLAALPVAVLPQTYLAIEAVPLTANGKVNKTVLKSYFNNYHAQVSSTATEMPEDPTEKILLDIFKKTLQQPGILVNDNFFECGGNSLLALEVLYEINQLLDLQLSLPIFYQANSVASLAHQIQQPSDITYKKLNYASSLVKIKSGDEALPPLFLIHPVGGSIFWFMSLAKHMQYEGDVYAIQDPGLVSSSIPFHNLKQMANAYIELAKTVCDNIVLLGGASFGATVAVEMALQLSKMGQSAPHVLLLDGWAVYPDELHTRQFLQDNMTRQAREMEQLKHLDTDKLMTPYIDLHWQRAHLLYHYEMQTLPFAMTLFKAETTLDVLHAVESPSNHWQQYCADLEVVTVPGDHESMFYEPAVAKLAKAFDDVICNLGSVCNIAS